MARDIATDLLAACLQTNIAPLELVKQCDYGQWTVPAAGNIQSQLSAVIIESGSIRKGNRLSSGAISVRHGFCLRYLRYLNEATETAGWAILAEAKLCANVFFQGKLGLPGWSQQGISVLRCELNSIEQVGTFRLDDLPIETVEIKIEILADHYD